MPVESPVIALVGNPNAGKTSLFNSLTGLHQKVGNYAGVTVERHQGTFKAGETEITCVDIPGLYTLNPMSEDEIIAAAAVRGEIDRKPDLFVFVLDASNLERNLYFFSQVAELGIPMIVALTMADLLQRSSGEVDVEQLSSLLGCPVVVVQSHKKQGIGSLKFHIVEALAKPEGSQKSPLPIGAPTEERYTWAAEVMQKTVTFKPGTIFRRRTDKADAILTHKVFGLIVFGGVMYLMFQSIYTLSAPIMDGIDWLFGMMKSSVGAQLSGIPWLQSLVTEGIIGGIGSVAIFLPQILILFGFIAILEGTGYLARTSFLMDKILGWAGLNGKAFIPLLSSYACAIPGIMATRIMPDTKSRLATILIAPLMSCSARLPVYVLLIGAFVEPKYGAAVAGLTLFGMHLVGLLVAVGVVLILNKRMLKGNRLPFLMELPPYQWPRWKDVFRAMLGRAKVFVQTAGTVIVAMSIVIWALLYFPRNPADEAIYRRDFQAQQTKLTELNGTPVTEDAYVSARRLENSALGRFGRFIEPVFVPAGFDWRISTAIVAAFPAREVMISSLGIIFDLSDDVDEQSTDLRKALKGATWPDGKPLFTAWTASGLMVFFALCCQCMSTLAIIRKETNSWKWPLFVFSYMTGLAWLAAVLIHQVSLFFIK